MGIFSLTCEILAVILLRRRKSEDTQWLIVWLGKLKNKFNLIRDVNWESWNYPNWGFPFSIQRFSSLYLGCKHASQQTHAGYVRTYHFTSCSILTFFGSRLIWRLPIHHVIMAAGLEPELLHSTSNWRSADSAFSFVKICTATGFTVKKMKVYIAVQRFFMQ